MPSLAEPARSKAAEPVGPDDQPSPEAGWRLPGWLVTGIPVAAALVVGGFKLGVPSLWRDEAYTLEASQRSFGQIFSLLRNVDAVHGPYYLAMHVVVSVLGTSAVALRLPSLIATALAAGVLAGLGWRLARLSQLPAPALTGLVAGLLYVAAPQTTFYAQNARPYGLVTLFAVASTYLLLVATERGGARWWAGYAVAIALTGVASLDALLILAAHGVTLLLARDRARLRPWLASCAAAVVVLSPMLALGYAQASTLDWVSKPSLGTVSTMVRLFAGSRVLIAFVAVLAVAGIASGVGAGRLRQVTVVTVALPWLVLPPFILFAVSVVKPVYVERYVVFCQPALALLCAAGLAWLARLVAATRAGRRAPALTWAAPAVVFVAIAVLLVGPQRSIRTPWAKPDNLRQVSAVVAAHERPGDAVFFLPSKARVISLAYPAPFAKLRDLALDQSPLASNSLTGTQVGPSTLARRSAGVQRVWLVQWATQVSVRPAPGVGREELTLLRGMHLIDRWKVHSVILRLYAA